MKTLHLVVCKKWFDLIKSGEKTEEYREVKPFWEKRLQKEFTHIIFQLGYSKNAPQMIVEYLGKEIREITHQHFNNIPTKVFSLKLGKVVLK